MNQALTMI